jgi:lysophospholipase L1-like esterase
MKGFARAIACVLASAGALLMATVAPAGAESDPVPGLPVQLALGDSWVSGVGASVPSETAYVPQLHAELQQGLDCLPASTGEEMEEGCKHLQLVNLGRGGATTPTMVQGQFPTAIPLLESRNGDSNPRNDVELVTVHIGGNDVTNPILAACLGGLSPTCLQTIQTEFAAFQSDFDGALSDLRSAAGSGAIVIGTYDNPIPTCELGSVPGAPLLAALVLEGGGPLPQGLNDIIRAVAGTHGAEVAEVFGDLAPDDWVGGTDCLHPDDSGYDKVTTSFLEALGLT